MVVAIPVAALLIALVTLIFVQRQAQVAERLVRHTFQVRQHLQTSLTLVVDAESGTRGYLLTDRKEWLEPYDNALRRLPGVLGELRGLVADNPVQAERVDRINRLAGARLEHLVVLQKQLRSTDAAAFEQSLERSKASMDAVRQLIGEMQADEDRLLAERSESARRMRIRLYWLTGASLAFGLAGGIVAVLLFARHVVRRIDELGTAAQMLAHRRPLPPVLPGGDEIGGLAEVLRETDRLLSQREAELREARLFLERLVETSPSVIFAQDPRTLAVTYVSPNVERVLGYRAEEVMGEPDFWMSRIHPEDRDRVLEEDRRAFAERRPQLSLHYRFRRPDGEYRWIESNLCIEYDAAGAPSRFVGHRLDVTERQLAEEALRRREAHLDAANKELEAFSYSVSHDLRAPLRSIDGFSQALVEDCAQQLDANGLRYVERVRAATQRMGRLIDDLLELSRVTRGPLTHEPVDLSLIASGIAHDLASTQPDRVVEFRIAEGLQDEGDPNLLRVVLENLLGNAWKFTSKHATARIEFGRNGQSYFVRDDGAGFDPAYADKLFGAFQRLHHARDFEGTGIGLATVQRVVRRHGGRIWAEGEVEKGATFYFTLHE